MLRHVRVAHGGKWTCWNCKASFNRENNFNYHTRTCDFKATGVKRSAPEQVGGGKKVKNAPIPENPVEKSIDLTTENQDGDNKYEALSAAVHAFKETLLIKKSTDKC